MVSNEFKDFKANNNVASLGVHASYVSTELNVFEDTIAAWVAQHNPTILYCRDGIQTPDSLEFALNLLKSEKNNLKTFYWITHTPLVVPKERVTYTYQEGSTSMWPVGI